MNQQIIEELDKDDQLQTSWSFWETFKGQKKSYTDNMNEIISFDSLTQFAGIWNNFFYKEIKKICYDKQEDTIKKVQIGDKLQVIESVCLFRQGIQPAWEDEANHKKTEIRLSINQLKPDEIDQVWEEFVFLLIGEQLESSDRINGIRFLDKTQPAKMNRPNIRLEIWLNFGYEEETLKKQFENEIKAYIEKTFEYDLLKKFDVIDEWNLRK